MKKVLKPQAWFGCVLADVWLSVFSLPHIVVGWSLICDCSITCFFV